MKKRIMILLFSSCMMFSIQGLEVLEMWKSPMPNGDTENAGYELLSGINHYRIYTPEKFEDGGYNHHSKITFFNGKFYAMWSNQKYGEDAPGQRVLYATSKDGKKWSEVQELFPSLSKEGTWNDKGVVLTAQEWLMQDNKLYAVAYCNITIGWKNMKNEVSLEWSREFNTKVRKVYNFVYREVKSDGQLAPLAMKSPEELPKDILVKIEDLKNIYPKLKESSPYNFNPMIKASKRRLCEPAFYTLEDGRIAGIFRDDHYSHRKWVSFSSDNGKSWSNAMPTNIPDSPSLSVATQLENGIVLLIGNHIAPILDTIKPAHYSRSPLTLSISKDGINFTKTYSIKNGMFQYKIPNVRGRGVSGAQYPDVIIVEDNVYVMYSLAKEAIEVVEIPISAIQRVIK